MDPGRLRICQYYCTINIGTRNGKPTAEFKNTMPPLIIHNVAQHDVSLWDESWCIAVHIIYIYRQEKSPALPQYCTKIRLKIDDEPGHGHFKIVLYHHLK